MYKRFTIFDQVADKKWWDESSETYETYHIYFDKCPCHDIVSEGKGKLGDWIKLTLKTKTYLQNLSSTQYVPPRVVKSSRSGTENLPSTSGFAATYSTFH